MIEILTILIFFHFVMDYPLQGDFLSKAKNPYNPIPGIPWYQAMTAHSFMHAVPVGFFTGSPVLGVIEFGIHYITDMLKCRGNISYNMDQAIHIGSKIIYVLILAAAT